MQVNSPRPSMQVPRFLQGLESHSLTFISHLGPEYPCKVESEIHGSRLGDDHIYLGTLAAVGAVMVDTDPVMFTRRGHPGTLVNVLVTLLPLQAGRAGAGPLARHLVGVAPGARVAGVDQTLVVQVTQEARLAPGTLALVSPHLVVTSPSVLTRRDAAVVLVLLAVLPDEAVDADTLVAALGVLTSPVVLAGIVEGAFVHVIETVETSPVVWTGTIVSVDSINTNTAIHTEIPFTVINVDLAVLSSKS